MSKPHKYLWGQMLQVFLHMLDDNEKRKPHIVKINDALRRINHKPKMIGCHNYYASTDIIEKAMQKSWEQFGDGKTMTINAVCWLIMNRHWEDLKIYKLNRKHFEKMSQQGVSGYGLATAKILNVLEENIKELL